MRIGLLFCFALVLAVAHAEQIALANRTITCLFDSLGGRVLSGCVDTCTGTWTSSSRSSFSLCADEDKLLTKRLSFFGANEIHISGAI